MGVLGNYEFVVKDVDGRCFIMFVLASSEEEARSKLPDFDQVHLCKVVTDPAILCSRTISTVTFNAVVDAIKPNRPIDDDEPMAMRWGEY
jgi:hypothetical protein